MSVINLVKNAILKKNPLSLVHFLTNRCNARCSFCFIDFENPETFKGELTLNEIEKICKNLPKSLINVNFTGGEPFARKDIFEIANLYFLNTSIDSIFITSNGSLPDRMLNFSKKIMEKFKNKKLFFSISLDDFAEKHNQIRKLDNLFEKCVAVYHDLRSISDRIQTNIAITVSEENYKNVLQLYDELKNKRKIKAINAILVREEGVYKMAKEKKIEIQNAYKNLSNLIKKDLEINLSFGYQNSLQSRVMNEKNKIIYDNVYKTSVEDKFISNCYAGSLFGVIKPNGDVYPCEVLLDKYGNLRDHDYDLKKMWSSKLRKNFCKKIKDDKCFCTYECAWTFNVLGNSRYYTKLAKPLFKIGKI